jgi:hypothetical protein
MACKASSASNGVVHHVGLLLALERRTHLGDVGSGLGQAPDRPPRGPRRRENQQECHQAEGLELASNAAEEVHGSLSEEMGQEVETVQFTRCQDGFRAATARCSLRMSTQGCPPSTPFPSGQPMKEPG